MDEGFKRIYNEFSENAPDGPIQGSTVLKLMEIERLDSIADALERINVSLEALEPLADCVGFMPPRAYQKNGYSLFRIGGNVSTD